MALNCSLDSLLTFIESDTRCSCFSSIILHELSLKESCYHLHMFGFYISSLKNCHCSFKMSPLHTFCIPQSLCETYIWHIYIFLSKLLFGVVLKQTAGHIQIHAPSTCFLLIKIYTDRLTCCFHRADLTSLRSTCLLHADTAISKRDVLLHFGESNKILRSLHKQTDY